MGPHFLGDKAEVPGNVGRITHFVHNYRTTRNHHDYKLKSLCDLLILQQKYCVYIIVWTTTATTREYRNRMFTKVTNIGFGNKDNIKDKRHALDMFTFLL